MSVERQRDIAARRRRFGLLAAALLIAIPLAVAAVLRWNRPEPELKIADVLASVNAGDQRPARAALAQWSGRFGFESHVRLVQGALLLRSNEPEAALKQFAGLQPTGDLAEPALLWTGECLHRLGRYVEAERVLAQLAGLRAGNVDAHRWLGVVYYDLGASQAAVDELTKVAQLDPADYRPHRLIGLMHRDYGSDDLAIASYRQALSRSPPDDVREEVLRELAQSHINLLEFEAALEVLEDCTPDALSATLQAECYWNRGRKAETRERLAAARKFHADERRLLLLEARIQQTDGDPQSAVAPLKRILAGDPHDFEARYQLALLYRQLGQLDDHNREIKLWDESKELIRRLSDLNDQAIREPSNVAVRRELAVVCDKLGKHELAEMWRKAVAGYGEAPPAGARPASLAPDKPTRPEAQGPGPVSFVDVAQERGLRYSWPEQPRPMPILESFGSGCAAFDADNDGWQDVLLVADPHPKFFRNESGGKFTEIADSGLSAATGDWTGCAIGDYDGDGRLDILLTGFHRLALYRNVDGKRFEVATEQAGLSPVNRNHWGASAGFMDFDGDGWIDLVILNYLVYGPDAKKYCEPKPGVRAGCTPRDYPPEKAEIWRNTGQGRFELVPDESAMQHSHGIALVLAFTDLDDDGRMDFYIGNDGLDADLMHNLGDMRFENIGGPSGLAVSGTSNPMSAMAADWADYDRDGRLDLTVTNFQKREFALFRSAGNGVFEDVASQTGLAAATRPRLGFGAKWLDFNNDGWPDLAYANGHVYDNAPEVEGPDSLFRQPQSLFLNEQGRKFVDLVPTLGAGVQRAMVGRGSASADFNNDGRVDLLVVDYEGPAMLLENRTQSSNHWLTLDLRGQSPNAFAYGARIVAKAGEQVWVAEVSPASSYLSSSDPRIHWGLGETLRLDTLTIRWPSGEEQTLKDVAADQILKVTQPRP